MACHMVRSVTEKNAIFLLKMEYLYFPFGWEGTAQSPVSRVSQVLHAVQDKAPVSLRSVCTTGNVCC